MNIPLGPLGLGTAPLGNLYKPVDDDSARATLEAAWEGGIRYFDTAPHYGLGLAEERLGAFLRDKPREEFVVSTKVGRVLEPNADYAGGSDLRNGFDVPDRLVRRFDPTLDGVRRSIEDSLERMGLDRIDILYLHDPDQHDLEWGLRDGLPALGTVRQDGLVDAIGIGVNDSAVAARAVREGDLDVVMIAGRYTLLEQTAAGDLLPAAAERDVRIVDAAPFNSGLLATSDPGGGAHYNYGEAPEGILQRARMLAAVCADFGVELPVAALQFPLRSPLIETVVVGTANPRSIIENIARMSERVPGELWQALADRGLIAEGARESA